MDGWLYNVKRKHHAPSESSRRFDRSAKQSSIFVSNYFILRNEVCGEYLNAVARSQERHTFRSNPGSLVIGLPGYRKDKFHLITGFSFSRDIFIWSYIRSLLAKALTHHRIRTKAIKRKVMANINLGV